MLEIGVLTFQEDVNAVRREGVPFVKIRLASKWRETHHTPHFDIRSYLLFLQDSITHIIIKRTAYQQASPPLIPATVSQEEQHLPKTT